jgi:hypothetical protein
MVVVDWVHPVVLQLLTLLERLGLVNHPQMNCLFNFSIELSMALAVLVVRLLEVVAAPVVAVAVAVILAVVVVLVLVVAVVVLLAVVVVLVLEVVHL